MRVLRNDLAKIALALPDEAVTKILDQIEDLGFKDIRPLPDNKEGLKTLWLPSYLADLVFDLREWDGR